MNLKSYFFIMIIFTIVSIKTTYGNRVLIKYVKVSTNENKVQFRVLKVERR
ncbi:MAG: hypothetical protein ACRC8M_04715 [Cetobacterium sp.]|uniref:hypothetical protein n=1 Tax=Cetobacterium sp. TaxID=2071632 RepID=UPI003F2D4E06